MSKVLIVDDQEINRLAVATLLSGAGYRPLLTDDGAAALELARSERPDIAVIDLMMPEMDGFELAYRLRTEPNELSKIPIVFISATFLPAEVLALAEMCGVPYLLTRNTPAREILSTVQQALASPLAAVTLPPWSEFALALLRVHGDKLSDQVKTVIPALAELGFAALLGQTDYDGGSSRIEESSNSTQTTLSQPVSNGIPGSANHVQNNLDASEVAMTRR